MLKDLIISALATVLLVLLFSAAPQLDELPQTGNAPKYSGDSGTAFLGGGSDPAEVIIQETTQAAERATECATDSESEQAVASAGITITTKEEQSSMNEIVIAFWHGVAAVLIGEASALLVAAACRKAGGSNNGKA